MTREQSIRDHIHSLEDTIATERMGDDLDRARIYFFQDVLKGQQETLAQWLSPDPDEYSPEMVRDDIVAWTPADYFMRGTLHRYQVKDRYRC